MGKKVENGWKKQDGGSLELRVVEYATDPGLHGCRGMSVQQGWRKKRRQMGTGA